MTKRKPKLPTFEVWLTDEINGVPSGRRIVEAEIGRKWVYVRESHLREGRRHRVLATTWAKLWTQPITIRRGRR